MKPLVRLVAHLVFILGLSFLIVLPRHQYEWMPAMRPTLSVSYAEVNPIHSVLITLMVLGVMVITQLILITVSTTAKERSRALLLVVVSVVVWFLWYIE